MILRGISRLIFASGATPGWSVIDPARPDKDASRPGYVFVGGAVVNPPPPPFFVSCSGAGGVLSCTLGCTEAVDGYQVGVSPTEVAPTTWGSTATADYTQPLAAGSWYVFARSVRGAAVSTWTVYGLLETTGWTATYIDESMLGPGSYQTYPGLSEAYGYDVKYLRNNWDGGNPSCISPSHTIYQFLETLAVFTGANLGSHGGKYEMRVLHGSYYGREVGALFAARDEVLTSPETESYYLLCVCRDGAADWRIRLYSVVAGTKTELAESANIYSHVTTDNVGGMLYSHLPVVLQATGNTFAAYTGETLLLTHIDNSIPWTAERDRAGLYWLPANGSEAHELLLHDYLRVYARTVEALQVDPGTPADAIREDQLTAPFPASHLVRFSGAADPDLAGVALGPVRLDDSTPALLVVDEYATPAAASADETHTIIRAGTANTAGALQAAQAGGKMTDSNIADDGGALVVPEIAAPSTPASGKVKVYAKADGKVYRLPSSGAETELGGGGTVTNATDNVLYQGHLTGTSSVTVTIPSGVYDLEVEWAGKYTHAGSDAGLAIQYNSDSGTNYAYLYHNVATVSDHTFGSGATDSVKVCAGYGGSTYRQDIYSVGDIALRPGNYRHAIFRQHCYSTWGRTRTIELDNYWTNTADIVTTLKFIWYGSPTGVDGYLTVRRKTGAATADADTRLLYHLNGADAATGNVFDATALKHELILLGGAALDTGQTKLGAAALELDGTDDYGLIPGGAVHPLGNSDFTAEAFVRLRTDIGAAPDIRRILSYGQTDTHDGAWSIGLGAASGWGSGIRIGLTYRSGGSTTEATSSSVTIAKDTWYHVAVVRAGTTVTFYLNGVASGTATVSANLYVPRTAVDWYVGCRPNSSYVAAELHNGWIDELRVSSVARYTGAFTAPAAEFSA